MSSPQSLSSLFNSPSLYPPSPLCPKTFAGHTDDSTQTLVDLLKDNHESNHVFFNARRFHNHVVHHLLAIYALGANSDLLRAAYSVDKKQQLPAVHSPGPITAGNYVDHLGDGDYYQAYCTFFAETLSDKGVTNTLKEYVYSKKANYDEQREKDGKKQPEMFSRFLSGLLHPFIHIGYGLEFGIIGVVAEGLAQTAVHGALLSSVAPPSYWDDEIQEGDMNTLASRVSLGLNISPHINGVSHRTSSSTDEVTVFNILAMIQNDDSLSPSAIHLEDDFNFFSKTVDTIKESIRKYAEMWSLDIMGSSNVGHEVSRKIEELAWGCTVIYGLGSWDAGQKSFHADFALMHLVTSSLFLPSIAAYLPPHAIQLLLRTYFSIMISLWISKGRPPLRIDEEYLDRFSASPQEFPIPKPWHKPAKDTLSPEIITPNPWLAITQSALQHPEDHVSKIQRALIHWASLFGSRPVGYWVNGRKEEQLEGIELLDGSVFVRVAGMTANRMGWMREGQEQGIWGFELRI